MKLNTTKIKKELERLDWNYTDLAQKIKMSRQMVSYYMLNRKSSWEFIERVSKVFGIDEKDLLI